MQGHRHDIEVPRPLLFGMFGLALFSLLAAGSASLGLFGDTTIERDADVVTSTALTFVDGENGAVLVFSGGARSDEPIAVFEAGTGGFLRVVMRNFATDRKQRSLPIDAPFELARWTDGHLTVTDLLTGMSIDLNAFGAANAQTFGSLLDPVEVSSSSESKRVPSPTGVARTQTTNWR